MLVFHQFFKIFQRFFTNFSTRNIDNSTKRKQIERIENHANIRKNILDFFSFIEFYTTKNSIRNIFFDKRFFQKSRLPICSIQNRKFTIIFDFRITNECRDLLSFVFFVKPLDERYFFTFRLVGEKSFFHLIGIIFDDSICCVNNIFGRTIIFFQIDNFRFWIVFFEVNNILNIRAAPRINPLPIITHNAEISLFGSQNSNNFVLQMIGILIFIHEKMRKSIMKKIHHFRNVKRFSKQQQQIIKIHRILLLHFSSINAIHIQNHRSRV